MSYSDRTKLAWQHSFNPRPPKRTLCHEPERYCSRQYLKFQSTSSEEDVVSVDKSVFDPFISMFQSTSSEEDVVSTPSVISLVIRGAFQSTSSEEDVVSG